MTWKDSLKARLRKIRDLPMNTPWYKKLKYALWRRTMADGQLEQNAAGAFHQLYYDAGEAGGTWGNTYWLGRWIQKCPLDLWIYQEIIHELRPDLIVETGTYTGASAHFLATMLDLQNKGRVITIDINPRANRPEHPRLRYVTGSSISPETIEAIMPDIRQSKSVLVILDSDHRKPHVLEELRIFGKLVTPGSYLIVEDTNVNGHPAKPDYGPGPMEAVDEYLKETQDYEIDASREKFLLTFNPRGYLKRIR